MIPALCYARSPLAATMQQMVYMSVICPTSTPPRARAPESRGPLRSTLTVSPTSNSDVSPHARLVYIFLVVDILDAKGMHIDVMF